MTTFPPFIGLDEATCIPEKLPPRPAFGTSAAPYLRLEGELVPPAFVRDVLKGLAGELLASVDEAIVLSEPVPDGLRVVDASLALPRPSIVLVVTFTDTNKTVEVPAHGLVWAATESPEFEPISTLLEMHPPPRLASSPRDSHYKLPCYPIRVPYYPAWQAVHDYVHDQSTEHLLEYLLHAPREDYHYRPLAPDAIRAVPLRSPAHEGDIEDDLYKLERIRQLWINAAALQLGDDRLWETMALAWMTLFARVRREPPRP
ncbi:hypothetical protein JCM3774_004347 [Rhodotorula dairenensis]